MHDAENAFTWRDYEEHIYKQLADWAGNDAKVEFDQKIVGRHSKVSRQVDVLISGRFAGVTERDITAVVDCKYYTRDIDVKKVDEFVGFLDDTNADLGLLITNRGFSPAALSRAKGGRGIELRVIPANVERLPPVHHPEWDESYYESEHHEGWPTGPDHVVIKYTYPDPDALEYTFDPDNPPELFDDVVLSGTSSEITWDTDDGRAHCVRAILRHRHKKDPSPDDVKTVVRELAFHWEDGFPIILYDAQLSALGL